MAVIGHSVAFSSSTSTDLQTVRTGETATLEISSGQGRGSKTSKVAVPIGGMLDSYTSVIPVDSGVIVSMPFAEVLLNKLSFNEILIKAKSAGSVSSLTSLVTTIYGSKARVMDTAQLASTATSIIGSITLLFTAIAGVSLLVAAVGIMNVMLMAVTERIHEIGIFKAVGFKNRMVLLIFLVPGAHNRVPRRRGRPGVGAGASYSLAAVLGSGSSSTTGSSTATAAPAATTAGSAPSGFGAGSGGSSNFAGGPSEALRHQAEAAPRPRP